MKPLSVEDGMSDEQAVRRVWEDARCVQIIRGKWNIVYGDDPENIGYANILEPPQPSQAKAWADARSRLPKAQPAVPVEERTWDAAARDGVSWKAHHHLMKRMFDECGIVKAEDFLQRVDSGEHDVPSPWISKPIPEERTSEMEQLISELRERAKKSRRLDVDSLHILKLLDHIEGKAK